MLKFKPPNSILKTIQEKQNTNIINYETTQEEISEWLANEVTCDEIPEEITIVGMELCLTIFGRHDFKLEAVCTSDGGSQFWVELDNQFTNADEFISLIPDYGKIKLEDLPRA